MILDKQTIKKIVTEVITVTILLIIILKIVFFKESFITILIFSLSLIWLFFIPGYFIIWHFNLQDPLTRTIISSITGIAVIGISSYYLGILHLHMKYHVFLPIVIIIVSIAIKKIHLKSNFSSK